MQLRSPVQLLLSCPSSARMQQTWAHYTPLYSSRLPAHIGAAHQLTSGSQLRMSLKGHNHLLDRMPSQDRTP